MAMWSFSMSKKIKMQDNAKKQLSAFRKAARDAGCDDNEERFQDALRKVAKAKPSAPKPDDHDGGKQRANNKGRP
jgi:hypothetical protein